MHGWTFGFAMALKQRRNTANRRLILASIPAFPPVALAILDKASQDDISIRQLSDVISSDAVFSAQILRLANSPLFGCKAQIGVLKHALSMLGIKRIQGLAITVATGNYLKKTLKFEEFRRCWRHTLATAILCRELAHAASLSGDLAYTVGLMHDIGRLGLLVTFPREYAKMLRGADGGPQDLLEEEKALFGMDHCEVGRELAEQWNLPADFALTLAGHHEQPGGDSLDLHGVVCHGCRLADALGFSVVNSQALTWPEFESVLPPKVRVRLTRSRRELTRLVEQKIAPYDSGEFGSLVVMPPSPACDPDQAPERDGAPEHDGSALSIAARGEAIPRAAAELGGAAALWRRLTSPTTDGRSWRVRIIFRLSSPRRSEHRTLQTPRHPPPVLARWRRTIGLIGLYIFLVGVAAATAAVSISLMFLRYRQ